MAVAVLEHDFTVELKSKRYLHNISISDKLRELVLFEGSLGETVELSLAEGDVLEVIGKNGVLRVSISEIQLQQVLNKSAQRVRNKGVQG